MKNVLILTPGFSETCHDALSILREARLNPVLENRFPIDRPEQILPLINDDVIAIMAGVEPVGDIVLKAAKNCKVVSIFGTGVNPVTFEGAKNNHVTLTNTPGANCNSVADAAIGLMLAISRQITTAERNLRNGIWKRYYSLSLYKSTLGVVGMGAVGKAVVKRASGFDAKILGFDPFWDEQFAKDYSVERCELDDLLKRSDYITLHMPLIPQTRHMISEARLRMMKETAYIINTARGDVIDEDALYHALKEKKIAGAALDTFHNEPIHMDNPLFELDNVILTPHIAADSFEARNSVSVFAASNIVNVLSGKKFVQNPKWLVYEGIHS